MLGYKPEVHPRLLIDLVTARPLKIEQSGEQIRARIHRHHPAHDAADFEVKEWGHELFNQPRTRDVVRIENQDDFGVPQFHGILERRRLAAPAPDAMKGLNAPGKLRYK